MIYLIDSQAVTLASANTTKGAMGTMKLVNGFYNPTTSSVNAIVLASRVATVSGTPAGPLFYNYLNIGTSTVTLTNTTTGTIQKNILTGDTNAQAGSQMLAQVNVTLTATGSPTTALTQLCTIGGPAAVAAGVGIYSSDEQGFTYVPPQEQGWVVVPPGCVFGITATGAGTTHIVQTTLWWREVPISRG